LEFPEMSPRILNPAPMVELEVGPGDATDTGVGKGVIGVEAGTDAAGDRAGEGGVNGVAEVSDVLTDEIAV
jgi:hypothetical protein